MLGLSDHELDAVMAAARPLRPKDRDPFLRDVAAELANQRERGPGVIYRVVRETQRKFFDPPNLSRSVSEYD